MTDQHRTRPGGRELAGAIDRRRVLELAGAVTAAALGVGTATGRSDELSHQLNAARAGTRRYRDVREARDDGYDRVSPYVPGMGFHFERGTPARGTAIRDPPILVYFPNGSYDPAPLAPHDPDRDDDLVLGAVEYAVDSGGADDHPEPDIFADEESDRTLKVSEHHGWHYTPPLRGHALHAWVHRGNPAGVFHPENPTV